MKKPIKSIGSSLKNIAKTIAGLNRLQSPWEKVMADSREFLENYRRPDRPARVLCATGIGGHAVARVIDSLVATGLWLRGAETTLLLCDKVMQACEAVQIIDFPNPEDFAKDGPQAAMCDRCYAGGKAFYKGLPYPVVPYSLFVTSDDLAAADSAVAGYTAEACFSYMHRDLPMGAHAKSGVLRFFGKATFEEEDPAYVDAVSRRYLAASIAMADGFRNAIEKLRPDVVVAHHGIYVPQGILGEVARSMGVRVANWGPSYRNVTTIYSHGDTYHHTFLDEKTSHWENLDIDPAEERRLMEYLDLRRGGKGDWSWITPERGENVDEHRRLAQELKLDPAKPTFGLLTNVLWDATLLYTGAAFPDMMSWLYRTLDHFVANPGIQLIVRIHPHEVKPGNRQPVAKEIAKRYPSLPDNIKIINRESPYSTYSLMDLCRAVLIYGTKTGVELAPYGIPVIAAGEAWIRNKGLAHDVSTPDEYQAILERLSEIKPLPPETVARAKKYAYHYFFRRMIPISSLDPSAGFPPGYSFRTLADLVPGKDRGLDTICAGILEGKEFFYDPLG